MIRFISLRLETELLGIVILLGIIQAVLVNIVHVDIFVLNIFVVCHLGYTLLRKLKSEKVAVDPYYLIIVSALFVFVIIAAIIALKNKKELIYNFNMLLYIMWAYFNAGRLTGKFSFAKKILWVYLLISLLIHFFWWEKVARIFYHGEHFLGLTTMFIPRLYGLLFNPLSNAYFLLIIFYFLVSSKQKDYLLYFVLLVSILLCLVRASWISLFIFSAMSSVVKKKFGFIFLMFAGIVAVYFTVPQIAETINSIVTLQDSQGSAQLHMIHIEKALSMLKENIAGFGFDYGITLESWMLVFGLETGWFGLFFFVAFFAYSGLKMLKKKKLVELIILVSFIPIMIIIPFYTFNLPLLLFMMMIFRFSSGENEWQGQTVAVESIGRNTSGEPKLLKG